MPLYHPSMSNRYGPSWASSYTLSDARKTAASNKSKGISSHVWGVDIISNSFAQRVKAPSPGEKLWRVASFVNAYSTLASEPCGIYEVINGQQPAPLYFDLDLASAPPDFAYTELQKQV